MIILSIKNKIKIPEQEIESPSRKLTKPLAGAFLGSLIASPISSLLPGIGSGQAAVIGNLIAKANKKGFLVLLGATNTLVMGFSFLSLYAISKTRTGAAVAVQQLIGQLQTNTLILIITITLITGIIAFFLTKQIAKFFSQHINKINYTKVSIITLLILIGITILISGFPGLAILIASTLTGIYCISLKTKRTNMMGCLLLPTIILYLT